MRLTNNIKTWLTTAALVISTLMTNTASAEEASEKLALALPTESHFDDFDGLLKRRELRILMVYNKTFYFIDNGQPKGLSYEVVDAFVKYLNKKYKTGSLPIKATYIPVHRDEIIPALKAGRADIAAANLTVTERRLQEADFSAPFATGVKEVLVQSKKAPPITSLQGLSGAEVYVRQVSSYYDSLLSLNESFKRQGLAEVKLKLAPNALEDEDLLQMAASGLIDNIVLDDHKAALWQKVLPSIVVRKEVHLREDGQIAWMLRKSTPKLKAEIDTYVKTQLKGNKDHAWRLVKYLKKTSHLNDTQSSEARARFMRTVDLFRKYSERYNSDFLLMIAQGFQESRLDQKVRSRVGAIGVMQLMPATGQSMRVGDVHQLEPNIHAGIKYIRQIAETYFNDPAIDSLNRHLFSFAAYNAGPNRIQKLRKEAAKQGLNPNVWHNQVERVVAAKVGRETVNYVANIYAYYVAYTLAIEQSAERRGVREAFNSKP